MVFKMMKQYFFHKNKVALFFVFVLFQSRIIFPGISDGVWAVISEITPFNRLSSEQKKVVEEAQKKLHIARPLFKLAYEADEERELSWKLLSWGTSFLLSHCGFFQLPISCMSGIDAVSTGYHVGPAGLLLVNEDVAQQFHTSKLGIYRQLAHIKHNHNWSHIPVRIVMVLITMYIMNHFTKPYVINPVESKVLTKSHPWINWVLDQVISFPFHMASAYVGAFGAIPLQLVLGKPSMLKQQHQAADAAAQALAQTQEGRDLINEHIELVKADLKRFREQFLLDAANGERIKQIIQLLEQELSIMRPAAEKYFVTDDLKERLQQCHDCFLSLISQKATQEEQNTFYEAAKSDYFLSEQQVKQVQAQVYAEYLVTLKRAIQHEEERKGTLLAQLVVSA